jgi:hypothetical protein
MTSSAMRYFIKNNLHQARHKVHLVPSHETTKPERKVAIDNGEQFVRDAYLAIVETEPESKYDHPPMLEALTELGFLEEYDKGVFRCVRDPKLQRKAWSLGALAEQALKHGLEETSLNLLQQQRELFMC